MNIWITADTHFGHTNLTKYGRPENFEAKIIKGFKQINDDDILIHLGDVGFGKSEEISNIFKQYKFKKFLCKGNHDKKSNTWYLNNGFDFVCQTFKDRLFGKIILFSHIPIRYNNDYDINFHGHFHDTKPGRYEAELLSILNDRQRCIALEYTNYKPVLLNEKFLKEV